MFFFRKFSEKIDDFYHIPQIDDFLRWVQLQKTDSSEVVYINLPKQREFIEIKTGKKINYIEEIPVGFVVCTQNNLAQSLAHPSMLDHNESAWHCIFYATGIEIWENRRRYRESVIPIRFGLSERQKLFLLRHARRSMESFFLGTPVSPEVKPDVAEIIKSTEDASVDVCIWINGELRGSIIVVNSPIYEAVASASRKALRDTRMKPVESRELAHARIEINIFSDLKLPLLKKDIESSHIEAQRGYFVSHGGKQGWYIPTVFNCVKFSNMAHLKESLVKQKAKIEAPTNMVPIYTFAVESFIENSKHEVLNIQKVSSQSETKGMGLKEKIVLHSDRAAQWLCRMQDMDGHMPLYADPLYQKFGKTDWVRLSCTTQALAEYASVQHNQLFLNTAHKSFEYLFRHTLETDSFSIDIRIGTLVYLARTAITLGKETEYQKILTHIGSHWREMSYRPIILATLASLFAMESIQNNKVFLKDSILIAENIFSEFLRLKKYENTESTRYPELVCVFKTLYEATKEDAFNKKAEVIEDWLVMHQLDNGSFSSQRNTTFSYSRGTGKIFEVLALSPEKYKESIYKAFTWLTSMQYTEENLYFINQDFKSRAVGALRHDYANTEAWIDGVGHFLLGTARILRNMDITRDG